MGVVEIDTGRHVCEWRLDTIYADPEGSPLRRDIATWPVNECAGLGYREKGSSGISDTCHVFEDSNWLSSNSQRSYVERHGHQ